MARTLKIAAIQMDAAPAPLDERLHRAATLIAEAASSGAQLVVLPEVFNTGYQYHPRNYSLAERLDGKTVSWMKAQTVEHNIYLAGSLMLLEDKDIYNTALLIAPNGAVWRYDKNHPFLWERAYFRDGHAITIADTELGKLGMMICWDAAHPAMWQGYAGLVDAMVIVSCPPKLSSADLVFPDGLTVSMRELGGLWKRLYTNEEYFVGRDMDEHTAWLGVPTVHTVGGGIFRSTMPFAGLSLFFYLFLRPDLWGKLLKARKVEVVAGYDMQTKIIGGNGQVINRVNSKGDGLALAEVNLPEAASLPQKPQPRMRTLPFVYFFADIFAALPMSLLYHFQLRRKRT